MPNECGCSCGCTWALVHLPLFNFFLFPKPYDASFGKVYQEKRLELRGLMIHLLILIFFSNFIL
jgi:hypothetical protein